MSTPIATTAGVRVDLAELIALRLRARRLEHPPVTRVSGNRSATHASRFRGRGVDYAESRNYQPGDDIRQMDWRVTARTGRPHTKLFEEERERSILLVISHNPSMRFGTRKRFKSVQTARAAALIAWATTMGGDRIGAIGYGSGLHAEVKPGGGSRGALRVLRALSEWDSIVAAQSQPIVPLSQALQRAKRLARPGSQIILLDDGFDFDAAAEQALSLLASHCDVGAAIVTDPFEQAAPPPARYALQSDSGRILLDFETKLTRAHWVELFECRRRNLRECLRRRSLRCVSLDTPAEPEPALLELLGFDARRRKIA